MNPTVKKSICRTLVVSLMALSFQGAQAGLIGAEQATGGGATAERAQLLSAIDRTEVSDQLRAAGVTPDQARARVASLTDQEVRTMVQDMQGAPVGAGPSTAGWVAIVLVAGLIWYYALRK